VYDTTRGNAWENWEHRGYRGGWRKLLGAGESTPAAAIKSALPAPKMAQTVVKGLQGAKHSVQKSMASTVSKATSQMPKVTMAKPHMGPKVTVIKSAPQMPKLSLVPAKPTPVGPKAVPQLPQGVVKMLQGGHKPASNPLTQLVQKAMGGNRGLQSINDHVDVIVVDEHNGHGHRYHHDCYFGCIGRKLRSAVGL
jgi:hypothetical protein